MAGEDVIAVFRADISDMQKNIENLKKEVRGYGKTVDDTNRGVTLSFQKAQNELSNLNKLYTELKFNGRENGIVARGIAKDIDLLTQKLSVLDKANNKVVQTAGRLKSSFNGLGNSINQLSRELPAFTYSAQTGFLALSNNIPMLADQITMLKKANLELVASGQKSIPVWKSVAGALFSWQTGLSIGVTLLTLYGAKLFDMVKSLFVGADATELIKEKQEALNKELEKSIELNKILKDETLNYKRSLDEILGVLIKGGDKSELSITVLKKALSELNEELENLSEKNTIIPPGVIINSEKEFYQKRREFFNKEKADILSNIKLIEKELGIKEKGSKKIVKQKEIELDGLEEIEEIEERILFSVQQIADIDTSITQEELDRADDLAKKWQDIADIRKMAFNEAINSSSNLLQITSNLTQTEIDGIQKTSDAKIEMLDKQLEEGIISQKKYEDEKAKIEKNADAKTLALRQKQAEREKIVASFQAFLKGGLAVLQAFLELGPIAGAIAAVGIATEVAAIQTAPIPQFEKGGHIKGKRHKQGGVLIEAEGGEFINNRISTSKYKEELESANNLSLEKLIYRKHVIPALRKDREKIASALSNGFNDGNLLMSDRETRQILRDIRDGVKSNNGYSKSARFK